MANDRISQLPVEVVVTPTPPARLSQMPVEVVVGPPVEFKATAVTV